MLNQLINGGQINGSGGVSGPLFTPAGMRPVRFGALRVQVGEPVEAVPTSLTPVRFGDLRVQIGTPVEAIPVSLAPVRFGALGVLRDMPPSLSLIHI